MSSRQRPSLSDLANKPPSEPEEAPEHDGPPAIAPIDTIAANPDNPRDPEDLDLEELMDSITQVGILQPIVVMSRGSWLKLYPAHETSIGAAAWVVVGGNRRLEAARALAWVRVPIHVRDNLSDGEEDEHFLDEAVMVENIHRKNLAPLKEAAFLRRLVDRHGSQGKVAKRIGKTQAYVSQRLSLLNLEPELQRKLSSGDLKVKEARQIAGLPPEQQAEAWRQVQSSGSAPVTHNLVMGSETVPHQAAAPPAASEAPSASDAAGVPEQGVRQPATHNPVKAEPIVEKPAQQVLVAEPSAAEPAPSAEVTHNPVIGPEGSWGDPRWVHGQIVKHMSPGDRLELLKLLSE